MMFSIFTFLLFKLLNTCRLNDVLIKTVKFFKYYYYYYFKFSLNFLIYPVLASKANSVAKKISSDMI